MALGEPSRRRSFPRVARGLCVRPGLNVGRFDAKAGEDGTDLLTVGVPVMERLDDEHALFGLVGPVVQHDELGRVERLGEEPLPDLRVLVGAPFQLLQVGGVLLVLGPVRSLAAPRHITAIGLGDVVEDRQDAAVSAIAVALSIGNVFRRAWWPHQTVLGRVPGVPGYRDLDSYPDAEQLPGCVLFRFDAPLFFANARTFRDQVRRLAKSEPAPRWIVVAAEPITDVDTTAADMLEDLDEALNARGISLVFADMKDPVREKIERYELTRTIDPAHFFPTVGAAVAAFQDQFGADWAPAAGKPAR
jgi:anti-anti-sigma regulatory factor